VLYELGEAGFRIVEWVRRHTVDRMIAAIDKAVMQFTADSHRGPSGSTACFERLLMSFQPEPPSYWIGIARTGSGKQQPVSSNDSSNRR